nr:reverse transcriptase domain-containing protein [Tanacetum cinerariifolium]
MEDLTRAGILREAVHQTWVANPVMVKKNNGGWRMCVDFTDMNKAYPKDCYPLLEIDWKVESLSRFPLKCFMDAYKGYHQIQITEEDEDKTAFFTGEGVYCYRKIPFGLKMQEQRKKDRQALGKPEKSGRIAKWAIELGEHDIVFQIRDDSNKDTPNDLLIKVPPKDNGKEVETCTKLEETNLSYKWKLYTNGASSSDGLGAGLMLIDPEGKEYTYALRFKFKTTNNEAEYEALLAGLRIAQEMEIRCLKNNSRCEKCKEQSVVKKREKIRAIAAGNAWPFSHWGVNILGTLSMALRGLKFLEVAIEHSTKWIEENPLTTEETPFSLTYGSESIIPTVKSIVAKDERGRTKEVTKRKEIKEVASIEKAYYQKKLRMYHSKRNDPSNYKIGYFVLLFQNNTESPQVWQGPYMIREVHNGELYKISNASDHSLTQMEK